MLLHLQVKNFAIIEDIGIDFQEGFHALTGETGAGKSILVEALSLLMGKRASRDLVRQGQDQALVEGVFSSSSQAVQDLLEDQGIEGGGSIIIRRQVYRDRPSIARVNDLAVTNSFLRDLTSLLVDLAMQDETSSLVRPEAQMAILDSLAGPDQEKLLGAMASKMDQVRRIQAILKDQDQDPQARARERDLLAFQVQEIEDLALKEGEDEALQADFRRLKNSRIISQALGQLTQAQDLEDQVDRLVGGLVEISDLDEAYQALLDDLEGVRFQLSDLASRARDLAQGLEETEEDLYYVEERISTINQAKRKYGETYEDIMAFLSQAQERLDFLDSYDKNIEKLQAQLKEDLSLAGDLADQLRAGRRQVAKRLEEDLLRELFLLDIKGGLFEIRLEEAPLSETGKDRVVYYLATNPGEPLLPLEEIASGGEKSRIMLAFKSILAGYDEIETLIFDEIDSGMSGKTAQLVASKMKTLAKDHQLIVISHLPQIVAAATVHYKIEKVSKDGRTVSTVSRLEGQDRVQALATMISGSSDSQSARQTASEMLSKAKE